MYGIDRQLNAERAPTMLAELFVEVRSVYKGSEVQTELANDIQNSSPVQCISRCSMLSGLLLWQTDPTYCIYVIPKKYGQFLLKKNK
jgi:hypothetical protein